VRRVDHAAIRRARIGRAEEKFNETAARLRVHPADVHRATQWETLGTDEREAIVGEFLRGEKLADIADGAGVSASCVLRTVREAFSQARMAQCAAVT